MRLFVASLSFCSFSPVRGDDEICVMLDLEDFGCETSFVVGKGKENFTILFVNFDLVIVRCISGEVIDCSAAQACEVTNVHSYNDYIYVDLNSRLDMFFF